MTTSSPLSTGINTLFTAAAAVQFGKDFGAAMKSLFGTMQFQPGTMNGGCFTPAKVAPFTASMTSSTSANIDLGDGNTLTIDKNNSQMIIKDASGNETKIWGDPHVEMNGHHVGEFYGTTTFELKNGTKLTINTVPWQGNTNAFLASQVTITHGNQAMVIKGIDQNHNADGSFQNTMSLTESINGHSLDGRTPDGLVLHQSADGKNWMSDISGNAVTQSELDLTKPGNEQAEALAQAGGALTKAFTQEMSNAVGLWLFGASLGVFNFGGNSAGTSASNDNKQPQATHIMFPPLSHINHIIGSSNTDHAEAASGENHEAVKEDNWWPWATPAQETSITHQGEELVPEPVDPTLENGSVA